MTEIMRVDLIGMDRLWDITHCEGLLLQSEVVINTDTIKYPIYCCAVNPYNGDIVYCGGNGEKKVSFVGNPIYYYQNQSH